MARVCAQQPCSYMEPKDFRHGLNSTVQVLRSVSFNLQAAKRHIPGIRN